MKKALIISFIVSASLITKAQAQTYGVPDTLAYLNTIVANKAQYIGQPFSVLANALQIQIKFFSPFPSLPYDKTKETSTSFSFYFPVTPDEQYLTYPKLEIFWQPYLNSNQSFAFYDQYDGGWVPTVATYYGVGTIADIRVREYKFYP